MMEIIENRGLNKWEKILKENGIDTKKSVLLLVGNKLDLKSKVFLMKTLFFNFLIIINVKNIDLNDINKYAKQKNMDFYQTSANTGENVNKVRKNQYFWKIFFDFYSFSKIYSIKL